MVPHIHSYLYGALQQDKNLRIITDIRFDLPTRQWLASLTRPTVCFYVYDIQENTELRQPNPHIGRANGQGAHRLPPRRFDLRYLVCTFAGTAADEQVLLWRVLAVLLKHPELPAEALPEELTRIEPPLLAKVGKPDDAPRVLDLWNALDLPPRPAIFYTVTAPLDLEVEFAAPLVLTREMRYSQATRNSKRGQRRRFQIGGTLRDRQGRPLPGVRVRVAGSAAEPVVTGDDGRFKLRNVREGQIDVRLEREGAPGRSVTLTVPATNGESYDIQLDE
jgi:hypothetical protein